MPFTSDVVIGGMAQASSVPPKVGAKRRDAAAMRHSAVSGSAPSC